jgi:hypothetical protein
MLSNSTSRSFAAIALAKSFLLALFLIICGLSNAAPINEARSKVGALATLPLPPKMESLVDHALSEDGMVFVADKRSVWVRSPWSWEKIWTLPGTADSSFQRINALAVAKDAQSSDVLLVGTEEGIWSIGWSQREKVGEPWSVFALHFSAGERLTTINAESTDNLRVTSLVPLAGGAAGARCFAMSRSGISRVIVAESGKLRIGRAPFGEDVLQDVVVFPVPNGLIVCQEYPDEELRVVSRAGAELRKTDLNKLLGGKTRLRAAVVDDERQLLFVGTDRGLIAARLDPSDLLAGDWKVVQALSGFDVVHLSWCASRLLVVGNPLESSPARDAVQWESRLNADARPRDDLAHELSFTPASGGDFPSDIKEVLPVAEDALWVRASDRVVYEWTPKQWRRLSSAEHGQLDSPSFWQSKPRLTPPLVIPDDANHRLAWLSPHDARRVTHHEFDNPIAALVPDPSGFGFWSLDRAMPGLGSTFHSLRFHSRHGQFDTTDGVNYARHPLIARIEHRVAHGSGFVEAASAMQRAYFPESDDGSLLLPSGTDLFRVNGAEWRKLAPLNPLPEPERLIEMTPGAASSEAPWLALRMRKDSSAELVSVDVDETFASWKWTALGMQVPAEASARLIPESNGYVWLAMRRRGEDWTLQRISPTKLTLSISTPADEVPEFIISRKATLQVAGPVFTRQNDRHVFTTSGVVVCEDENPKPWMSLLPSAALSRPQFLDYFLGENDAFVRTGTPDAGGNMSAGPTYLLSLSGGRVTLASAPTPVDLPPAEPFVWFPAKTAGKPSAFWTALASVPLTSAARTWWSVIGTAAAPTFPMRDASTFHLPLPRLRELDAAAMMDSSEFKHSVPEWSGIFAASSGSSLAIIPPASPSGWENWNPPVPVELTARQRDGKSLAWNLQDMPPPERLPHDVVEIAVRFGRNYDDWWQTFPWLLRGRALTENDGDVPVWQSASERDELRLLTEAGRRYVLEFESAQADGATYNGIRSLPMTVEVDPTVVPPRVVAFISALVLGFASLLLFTFSRAARRAVLRALGRRWVFRADDCDVVVEVAVGTEEVLLTAERGGAVSVRQNLDANEVAHCAAGDQPTLMRIRAALLPPPDDSLQTISVRTPEEFFHHRLGSWLDGGWAWLPPPALPNFARVCGQTAVLPQMLAAPHRQLKRVRYAGLGWAGTPPLLVQTELGAIEAAFRRIRAHVLPRGDSPADLLNALCEADVVHVAAHATLTEIELRGRPFTASLLTDELLRRIRCRLLILSACDAGRTAPGQHSIAWPLIRAGVTVIGSHVPLDDTVARRFFPLLYDYFLPVTIADGPRLAAAIIRASSALSPILGAGASAPWRSYLNNLVLYGNPNLRLTVFHPDPN